MPDTYRKLPEEMPDTYRKLPDETPDTLVITDDDGVYAMERDPCDEGTSFNLEWERLWNEQEGWATSGSTATVRRGRLLGVLRHPTFCRMQVATPVDLPSGHPLMCPQVKRGVQ
jgi:hypothetical protein